VLVGLMVTGRVGSRWPRKSERWRTEQNRRAHCAGHDPVHYLFCRAYRDRDDAFLVILGDALGGYGAIRAVKL